MVVYIGDECTEWRGTIWCHMVFHTPDELHKFAARTGLKRGLVSKLVNLSLLRRYLGRSS